MCGITGFIDSTYSSDYNVLKNMTDTLLHRGPDGFGHKIYNGKVGLGHRRLSIIDLTDAGKQPMEYQQYSITYNGEIYNYQEIKKTLSSLGHTFKSNSDTEMILHAFEEWGISCVHRFIGMFAFAIYDKKVDKLILVRDRAGVKPLYYYHKDGLFLFGSELKAILKHPRFKKDINHDSVASYMQYGYVPNPHCIWRYTYKLEPGYTLEFSLEEQKSVKNQYWNVYDSYNKPKLKIDFQDALIETENILTSAFNYRMVSDVPIGVFLSGGYDSTTVAAILQKGRTEKIKTFTIGVPDAGLNEAPAAKEIAKHLETDHTEYYCTEKEALEIITRLPYFYDEPFADSSAIPTTLVSKIAREDVTVSLSADAGDEIFAGYNRYHYLSQYGENLNKIPSFLRKGISNVMAKVPVDSIPLLKHKYVFHNRYEKFANLLKDPSSHHMLKALSQQFNDEEIKSFFLQNNINNLSSAIESTELESKYFDGLSHMMAVDYQTYLVDDILQKVDRATMSFSLEGREPFLDHRIIEWAAQLPNDYKYRKGVKKYILKKINEKYIPVSLMNRPKMGFGIPIAKWLSIDLKDTVYDFCKTKKIKEQGIFDSNKTNQLLTQFYSGRSELSIKIWHLLMFQMWYDEWN